MNLSKEIYQNFIWRGIYFLTIFLLNIGIARVYEAEQSGWINFITSNYSLAILIASLSLEITVLYQGATNAVPKAELVGFSFLWVIITSIGFYLFVQFYVNQSQVIAFKGLIKFGACCYFIGMITVGFFQNLFQMQRQYIIPNVIMVVINLLLLLAIPGFIWKQTGWDLQSYLYLFFASYVVQALLMVVAFLFYEQKIAISIPKILTIKTLFRYTFITFLANISFFFLLRLDYWFMNKYRSGIELGNYIQATKICQIFLLLSLIASTAIFVNAKTIQLAQAQRNKLLQIIRLLFVFFCIVWVGNLIFGQSILVLVFGNSFYLMSRALVYLIPGIFFLSVIVILAAYFGGIGAQKINVMANVYGFIFMLAGNLLLVPKYGINAAAAISTFSYGVAMCYCVYQFRKNNDFQWTELFSIKKSDFNWLPFLKH